ncbi:MAG: tol-pal system protein YbgF [Nitratireductor sp.]|nr:tol-pal system protein YbgF [Nitratireductor sp.]
MRRLLFAPVLFLGTVLVQGAPDSALATQQGPVPAQPVAGPQVRIDGSFEMAQSADAQVRVNQLEEQVRELNGRIEDLNFQLLQMQEQFRKMQEDNEFRFQELENKRGDLGSGDDAVIAESPNSADQDDQNQGGSSLGKSQPSEQTTGAQRSDGDELARAIDGTQGDGASAPRKPRTIDGVEIYDGEPIEPGSGSLQPGTLGTLTFDKDGNVVQSESDKPIDLTGRAGLNDTASLALPEDPQQLYDLGYSYIQSGDYERAENAFEEFSSRYPDNEKLPEARFWVGESMLQRGMNEEAAKVFLEAHRKYPDSRLGPQTLLKLGIALGAMNQRELACATYAEVGKKYPSMSNAIKARVSAEQQAASCKAS